MKIELFYDKECPFCNSYANYIKIKEKHDLILLNARENKKQIEELKNINFDINNGFIVKVDEKILYQGIEAVAFLNTISSKRVYFPNNFFFRTIVYPFIKFCRKVVLFIFRKKSSL